MVFLLGCIERLQSNWAGKTTQFITLHGFTKCDAMKDAVRKGLAKHPFENRIDVFCVVADVKFLANIFF